MYTLPRESQLPVVLASARVCSRWIVEQYHVVMGYNRRIQGVCGGPAMEVWADIGICRWRVGQHIGECTRIRRQELQVVSIKGGDDTYLDNGPNLSIKRPHGVSTAEESLSTPQSVTALYWRSKENAPGSGHRWVLSHRRQQIWSCVCILRRSHGLSSQRNRFEHCCASLREKELQVHSLQDESTSTYYNFQPADISSTAP